MGLKVGFSAQWLRWVRKRPSIYSLLRNKCGEKVAPHNVTGREKCSYRAEAEGKLKHLKVRTSSRREQRSRKEFGVFMEADT